VYPHTCDSIDPTAAVAYNARCAPVTVWNLQKREKSLDPDWNRIPNSLLGTYTVAAKVTSITRNCISISKSRCARTGPWKHISNCNLIASE
jgi:hypothetical protein